MEDMCNDDTALAEMTITTEEEITGAKIKSNYVSLDEHEEENTKPSCFSAAFSKLKGSEFYEEPQVSKESTSNAAAKIPAKQSSKNSIIVHSRQRGNPILNFIRKVPWEFGEIVPDYVMGATTCAMFLSLRYHVLNPNYIHERLKVLGQQYELRVLLVQVDMKDRHVELKQLSKICFYASLTLMLAWSPEEAGTIIEGYKVYENKPPDLIMEKQEENPVAQMIDALTSIKSINRTDAMTLLSNFGSLEKILNASSDELALCPGLGPQKATNLHSVLHQPFKKTKK